MRGKFKLFACRSGIEYATQLLSDLKEMSTARSKELQNKSNLTSREEVELEISTYLSTKGSKIGKANIMAFDDGEMDIMLDPKENVRDKDVFLVQNHYSTANDISLSENVMETLIFIDALKRAKAKTINLISLYYPYARGDKQHGKDGVPAKLFSKMLTASGVNNLISMDLHADQIIGFFDPADVRVEHIHIAPLMFHYLKNNMDDNGKITAPDVGAAKRAQKLAKALDKSLLMAYKRRSYEKKHQIDEMKLLGLPSEEEAVIVDDIVASGGSVRNVIDLLKEKDVKKVSVACTHPLLTGKAIEKFDEMYADKNNPFQRLIAADTVHHCPSITSKPWYVQIKTTKYLARVIYEINSSGSLTPVHEIDSVEKLDLWVD